VRIIVHVDMDAFYCAVETQLHPAYRGQPLIVGGYKDSRRAVVASCSYEARRLGVHSAMPIVQAARLCPQGIFIPPNFERYREVSAQVHEVFQQLAPVVEPLSIDEAFLDMTADAHLFPDPGEMGLAIKQRVVDAVGCTASVGIAPCKFLAKLASDLRKPDGLVVIRPSDVDGLLLPLPVRKLWGVGEKTAERLAGLGVHTVADLRQKSLGWLSQQLGKWGTILYDLCRGIDERPVEPPGPAKSIGHEITFPTDLRPGALLTEELRNLSERVAQRLQQDGRYARTVSLKVRFCDFDTVSRQRRTPQGVQTSVHIMNTAHSLLRSLQPKRPVRLLGVYVSELTSYCQLGLF
jgi:DNA polymerase-4